MNCETYLSMLSTLPVEELAYGDAREHAATCRDCERVTRVVSERERNMLIAYGDVYTPVATEPYAAQAIELSRRRRVAFVYRVALAVAGAAAVLLFVGWHAATARHNVQATFELQCLSPEQAIALVQPGFSRDARIRAFVGSGPNVVRFSAPPFEIARIRALLRANDGPANCTVIAVPAGPPPR